LVAKENASSDLQGPRRILGQSTKDNMQPVRFVSLLFSLFSILFDSIVLKKRKGREKEIIKRKKKKEKRKKKKEKRKKKKKKEKEK